MRKNKKNTKIQSVFLAAIEKYKKNTKVQGVFFSYFLCIYFVFLQKKYEKIRKKYEKNTNPKSQKYKIQKKNTNPKSRKYKIQKNTKKIRIQNLKNTKYEKKGKSHVHFRKKNPNCKKNAKTTCCIFYTLQF